MSFLFSLFLGCKLITTETIGSFNPFEMKAFRCPVCQSEKFVEVKPYGGVWCAECNAAFSVKGTCDGQENLRYPAERNIAGKKNIGTKLTSMELLSGKETRR